MKSLIFALLLGVQPFLGFALPARQVIKGDHNAPHLILHFDVNKTLIAQDKASQKSVHDIVASCIADRVKAVWDQTIASPITYSDYVKNYKLKNLDASPQIKKEQDALISKVLTILKEQDHPQLEEMQNLYRKAMDALLKQEAHIFKSFYKLIDYLEDHNIEYSLAIRTFGTDLSDIVEEINEKYGKDFIQKKEILLSENLYEICQKENIAVQDDYQNWFSHQEAWQFGKPFPVDVQELETISLFFDDNAYYEELHPEKNIVCPYDIDTGKLIHPKQLIDKKRLIPVDMLQALFDEDYYIHFVKNALKQQEEKDNLPIFDHYAGSDGGYIAVYTHKKEHAVYGIGNGIYVAGFVRVQGQYDGRIFIPTGYARDSDITQDPILLNACRIYFPKLSEDIWIGGDTRSFFEECHHEDYFKGEQKLSEIKTTVDLSNLHLRSWDQNIIQKIQWVYWEGEIQGLITLVDGKKLFFDEFATHYIYEMRVGDHIEITQKGHSYYVSNRARLANYSLSADKHIYFVRDNFI